MPKWNSDFQAWEPDEIDSAAESALLLKHAAGSPDTRAKPGIKASALFHAELAEREFSSHVFRVPDLLEWAAAQGLTIDTEPDIRAFEFVQAEALLVAIERKVGNTVTPEQALELVASNPELSRHQLASKPISARWLLGAEAHRQWRHLLGQAIENGELRLLDFASKLPIAAKTTAAPPDAQAAAPEPLTDRPSNAPAWTVNKPQRYSGYAAPLHRLLAAAHRDGNPCPTARDVVEAWRNNAPAEIAKVLPDGFDYYDAKGDTKTADLEAIRKAIGRMTIAR